MDKKEEQEYFMLRQGVFLIPLLYATNALFGVTGNIIAHIIADITAAAVAIALALRQYGKLKQSVSESAAELH